MRTWHRLLLFVAALAAAAGAARAEGGRNAPTVRQNHRGDIVISGGGAAGAVMAVVIGEKLHRSGKPGKVIVIDAGGNEANLLLAGHAHSADPASRLSKGLNLAYPVQYHRDEQATKQRFNYNAEHGGDLHTRGKGRGGSSNHHAGFNLFPPNSDWEEIAQLTGDDSWKPQAMAKYEDIVRRLIPVETTGFADSSHLGEAVPQKAQDPNSPQARAKLPEGLLQVPVNTRGPLRYGPRELLNDAIAKYPGRIEVLENTVVDHAVLDAQGKVIGVKVIRGAKLDVDSDRGGQRPAGTEEMVWVDKAYVDALGAFGTPGAMTRAGIGDPGKLAALGIPLKVALPGVGQGLGSRIEVPIITKMNAARLTLMLHRAKSRNGGLFLVGRKSRDELPEADGVQIGLVGRFTGYNWGYSEGLLAPAFTQLDLQARTHSYGSVETVSSDPLAAPHIQFGMFDPAHDPQGLDLKAAVKGARQMLARARRMGGKEIWDLESKSWVPLETYEQMSDERLGGILKRVGWDHHPSGTARIGKASDPMTVTQSDFKVRGTQNYFAVSLALFRKPLSVFPVYGLYAVAVKAGVGLYDKFYTQSP